MARAWKQYVGALRYGSKFHRSRDSNTALAAERILRPLLELTCARSVCDVGCGVGTWLRVARELGVGEIAGFEGTWVAESSLLIEPCLVERRNLEERIFSNRRFDLVLCLEVAEHLSVSRAETLVSDLAGLSDVVLFSAAIPHQGGTGHRNERWQSYWARLFSKHGYEAFDFVRPAIWADPELPFWYRQNALLYARDDSPLAETLRAHGCTAAILDVVHPTLYERHVYPRLDSAMKMATRMIRRALGIGRAPPS